MFSFVFYFAVATASAFQLQAQAQAPDPTSSGATSDSCKERDLNKDPDSPFNKIPIYDQDGSGICYAYPVVQMVDYYRIKHGDQNYDLTNPAYATWLAYYKNPTFFKSKSLDNGGNELDVYAALKKNGTCANSEVQERLSTLMKAGGNLSEPELLWFLEVMYKNYNGFSAPKNWNTSLEEFSKYVSRTCSQSENLRDQLKKMGYFSLSSAAVLDGIFKGCSEKKVAVPDIDVFNSGSDEKMKPPITDALQKGMPADISVCSGVFKNPNLRGLRGWPLFRNSNGNSKEECHPHSVIISAQASINSQCHYLIRNSWGSHWRPKGSTACACITHEGKYKQLCAEQESRENVGCWFKQDDVLPNVDTVYVFK